MQEKSDAQLLSAFAGGGDEAAFCEIVARYTDLVYSAALRQVESSSAAADIAQGVFTDLARKAGLLARGGGTASPAGLAGWLHRATRYAALNYLRDTRRRLTNEKQAMEQLLTNSESAVDWEQIRPMLDEALDSLADEDREALLLRYFKNHDFRAVGLGLGVTDDAAQKRVSRAVDRLREFFSKRNVTIGAGGLIVLISGNAIQAAPAGLAAAISTAALAGTAAVATSTIFTATKAIAMTTLQKALFTVTVAALAGAGIYEARQAARLREQLLALQQRQMPLAGQVKQAQNERDDAMSQLAGLRNRPSGADSNELELLKLRGEVALLKNGSEDSTEKAMKAATARVKLLKQLLAQRPDKKIPELKFLTDKDWADAAWNADLSTDDGIRLALSELRGQAENIFLNEMMKAAMKKYLAANGNVLPASLLALEPYFDVPVTDDMLQRYQLMQSGTPDNSADLVKLIAYADDDYDSNHNMSINGASGGAFNRMHDAIYDATMGFTLANYGQQPTDPSQIIPYLKRSVDPVTMQKYFGQITADFAANPPSPEQVALIPALNAYKAANNGQFPKNPSDLSPYATTPEQQAALKSVEQRYPSPGK